MGFEVELKFRVADPADLDRRLRARADAVEPAVDHEDTYFAHPARDFARTGEAFRIRGEGDASRITYKGPKRPGAAKTREEIEVDFAPGLGPRGDLRRVLERLGFEPVLAVRKRRTEYRLDAEGRALTVAVDHAEGLGDFAEVETLVDGEADLDAAQAAVVALAGQLGLDEVEPRSYLRMHLEAAGRLPRDSPGPT